MKRHGYEKMKRHDCEKMKNSPTDTLLAGSARFSSTPLSRFHYAVVGRGFMLPLYRAAAFSDVEPSTTQVLVCAGGSPSPEKKQSVGRDGDPGREMRKRREKIRKRKELGFL
ncbi:hypothetical protein Dimus_016574, partial [Dionaea muscipula]